MSYSGRWTRLCQVTETRSLSIDSFRLGVTAGREVVHGARDASIQKASVHQTRLPGRSSGAVRDRWDSGKFSYWCLPFMAWGVYELWIVPTSCKATTTRKGQCTRGCYGLLKGCRYVSSHGPDKRADLLRALTAGRAQAISSPAGGTAVLKSELLRTLTPSLSTRHNGW
jgi:hypothetical protein